MLQFRLLGVLLGLVLLFSAWAQSQPLEVTLEGYLVQVITKEDGSQAEEFVAATQARPGQVVEYRVLVTNVSNETLPASNAMITGPVPNTTTYLADSATATGVEVMLEFSADGGQSFAEKPMLEKENEQGEKELVEALPEEYNAARWALLMPIEPAQSLTFTYRVTVN
jgi:uncharacterized repeat protein (TIGR01451 family)